MIPAGALRHRVRFERRSVSQDQITGQRSEVWTSIASRRAEIKPIKAQQQEDASGEYASSDYMLRVRFDSSLNLTEEDRFIELKTKTIYQIDGVLDINLESRVLSIMATRTSRHE